MLARPGDGRWDEETDSKKIENKSKGLLQECRDSYHCVIMFHESGQQQGCRVQILFLFLGRSQAEGKYKEKVHALVFPESIYILSTSFGAAHSDGMSDREATVLHRLMDIGKARASTQGQTTTSLE